MGVISISNSPEKVWQVAGWAFRQVLDDVLLCYPEDVELAKEFDMAKVYDSLSIYDLPPQLSARATEGLRLVAQRILAGQVRSGIESQPYGDSRTQADYKTALKALLLILSSDR